MPTMVLLLTDEHTAETVMAVLPAGCVYVGLELTDTEWATTETGQMATGVLGPMLREAKRRWPEVHVCEA